MLKSLTLAGLVAASFTSANAQETPYPDTIVILDVSNSMWGQIDGVAKIEIARNVLGDLVTGLETESEFGLMAYGQGTVEGCANIEMVLPVGPLEAASFAAAVNGLTPHGQTPLVAAVDQAADSLSYTTRSARIVLVTDGIESCGGDLRALTDELAGNGLDFAAHVIAFDVADAGEQAELSYLAAQTGGLFVSADSTAELKAALQSMMGDMETPMETPMEPENAEMGEPTQDGGAMQEEMMEEEMVPEAMQEEEMMEEEMAPEAMMDEEMMPEEMMKATITAAAMIGPRERIEISFTGPMGDGMFIGLAKAGESDVIAVARADESGRALLIAPRAPGSYELRYFSQESGEILAMQMIEVQ